MTQQRTKLISVIIPVYNGANYVREAIDSVLHQTLDDYELIVVDDGSTDDTPAIVQSYGVGLTYIRQKNQGVAAALNNGIGHSQGNYIAWLSHDDVFLPNKLECQIQFLKRFQKFKACYTDLYIIDSNGTIIREVVTPWYPRQKAIRALFGHVYIDGSSMLIERSSFDTVGLFNEEYRYTQDTEMWIRMLRRFEIGRVPEKLLKSRVHPNQGSRNVEPHVAEELIMYKEAFEKLAITDVFPEFAQSTNHERCMARAYKWFGDTMAFYRRRYTFADEQYRQSVALWPSWSNPARLKLCIGTQRMFLPRRLYHGVGRIVCSRLRAERGKR